MSCHSYFQPVIPVCFSESTNESRRLGEFVEPIERHRKCVSLELFTRAPLQRYGRWQAPEIHSRIALVGL
jgi:hypothetical protein